MSIRFLQATGWPSLLRNTVWKLLQKPGCKKFLPHWVECCIRAARYRLQSHLASKKKCWRNAAVSIRFLQATAWPSLLRNTVWKFLQKFGCKKFLPPWVECCIRAARYRLTITPGIKKKVLAECCSVHQIFAGNRLTITSEKHSVEIAAETWM